MAGETHTNGRDPLVGEEDRVQPDRLPVLASEARPLERRLADSPLPAPAVVATGGFLAGIATLVLVRVLRRSASARSRRGIGIRRSKRGDRSLEIAGSRSFLVDVHILKR
ncbi:MAG: hypothetical protein QOJ12_2150 [Thermoleophilales bacterium]|jgi:hypothetical protein|nr:hypothetical protein [Thermoleophilales bacterium]